MMRPVVTNVWAALRPGIGKGMVFSVVAVEYVGRGEAWHIDAPSPFIARLVLPGFALNFRPIDIPVNDGLVHDVSVEEAPAGSVRLTVNLEREAAPVVVQESAQPARIGLFFDRASTRKAMAGRVVAIDPGHGGHDTGFRGPVNLLEKDLALQIGRLVHRSLYREGATAYLTRASDKAVPDFERVRLARRRGADCFLSIHMGGGPCTERGARTGFWSGNHAAPQLARSVQASLVEGLSLNDRGIHPVRAPMTVPDGLPGVALEVVCISNPVEEGLLRSITFKERVAWAICRGLASYFSDGATWTPPNAAQTFVAVPVRTHVLTEDDDMVEVVKRYTGRIARGGDIIAIAESPLAITQGRTALPANVRPGALARFLARFPGKNGSLATPPAMQLAIQEAGLPRILIGTVAGGVGRLVGRRGDFFRVAGPAVAQIDDIAGTMRPYHACVVLGPKHPDEVARRIREATGVDAVIVDVNDLGNVDVVGGSAPYPPPMLEEALRANPFGNDDECTPIVVLKPARG